MSDLIAPTPTWVTPIGGEEYFTEISESEDFNKEYFLISNTPARQYNLNFLGLSDSDYAILLTQYRSVSGEYAAFYWKSISPNFYTLFEDDANYDINDVSMYGHWVGQPKKIVKARSWDVEMLFEEEKR